MKNTEKAQNISESTKKNGVKYKARRSVEEMSAREKINIGAGREESFNPYYMRVAKGYKFMKFLALFVLIAYVGIMLGMYHSEITYDNLMYLIKDLDTDVSSSSSEFAPINFDESSRLSMTLYHDRLAVCTSDTFRLFNTAGASEVEYTHSMEAPALAAGDKYVMAYDIGGTSYSIYTTIARVLSKQTEYQIQGAAMSKVGEYALITRARENRYVVNFYDRNFREISKVYKDKYVTSAAISENGKNYCIASFEIVKSDFVCEVMYGSVKSDLSSSFTYDGALPLFSSFFSDGTFAVVCDTAILFFDDHCNLTSNYKLSGITLSYADVANDRVLIVGKENLVGDVNSVTVLDKDANVVLKTVQNGKMNAASLGNDHVFEAVSGTVYKMDFSGARESEKCALSVNYLIPTGSSVLIGTSNGCTTAFLRPDDASEDFKTAEERQEDAESDETDEMSGTDSISVDLETEET